MSQTGDGNAASSVKVATTSQQSQQQQSNMMKFNLNNRNLNESPLITVSGELSDFIINGLSTQLIYDLGRESIEWQRSYERPVSVYLEANFVPLDEDKHLLSESVIRESAAWFEQQDHCGGGGGGGGNSQQQFNSIPYNSNNNRSMANHHQINSNQTLVKRNHSFNVIRRNNSQISHENKSSTTQGVDQTHSGGGNGSNNSSKLRNNSNNDDKVNYPLVRLVAQRVMKTNGANVLINSYWIDSSHDLESYNAKVREPLLKWFNNVLTNAAANNRLRLWSEFLLDCIIVIVCRNELLNSRRQTDTNAPPPPPQQKSSEQLLSLEKLITDQQQQQRKTKSSLLSFKNGLHFTSPNKYLKSHQQRNGPSSLVNPLSSSLTSLTTSSSSATSSSTTSALSHGNGGGHLNPSPLSVIQLVDQIRNDLTVSFQVFQQKQFTESNFDSNIPTNLNEILKQLLERILVFDYTSNEAVKSGKLCQMPPPQTKTMTTSSRHHHERNPSGSNLPLSGGTGSGNTHQAVVGGGSTSSISIRSALSNFGSGGSIKINTGNMMSPSKGGGASSSSSFRPSSTGNQEPLVTLHYSTFVDRIRCILLDAYARHFDSIERTVIRQRELRNKAEWDYFGFFLLQEELAMVYENLGLYDRALMQYDVLDALFESLLANEAFGASPKWIERRLMIPDHHNHHHNHRHRNLSDKSLSPLNRCHSSSSSASLYDSWNGLCLCNAEVVHSLRLKLVQCVLTSPDTTTTLSSVDNVIDQNSESSDSPPPPLSPASPKSSFHMFDTDVRNSNNHHQNDFLDPLGVRSTSSLQNARTKCSPIVAQSSTISLIQFRNYLFARQCHLLCLLNQPWVLAERALPFLNRTVMELKRLDIPIPASGIACWGIESALEILQKCERYSDSSQLELYSKHTVGLWDYARQKLVQLGKECHLMPGEESHFNPSDHCIQLVELAAGMGNDPHIRVGSTNSESWSSPQERLKDALDSPENFLKTYFEISELTMGTYKHINNFRTARVIGNELAELYLKLNKPQQALPFILDLHHMLQLEPWQVMQLKVYHLLANCLAALYFKVYNIPQQMFASQLKHTATTTTTTTSGDDQENEELLNEMRQSINLFATVRSAFRANLVLLLSKYNTNLAVSSSGSEDDRHRFHLLTTLVNHAAQHSTTWRSQVIKCYEILTALDCIPPLPSLLLSNFDNDNNDDERQRQCQRQLNNRNIIIHNSFSDLCYNNTLYNTFSSISLSATSNSSLLQQQQTERNMMNVSSSNVGNGGSGSGSGSGSSSLRSDNEQQQRSTTALPHNIGAFLADVFHTGTDGSEQFIHIQKVKITLAPNSNDDPTSSTVFGDDVDFDADLDSPPDSVFVRPQQQQQKGKSSSSGEDGTRRRMVSNELLHRLDRSTFTTGTRLQLRLQIVSDLSCTIPIERMEVTTQYGKTRDAFLLRATSSNSCVCCFGSAHLGSSTSSMAANTTGGEQQQCRGSSTSFQNTNAATHTNSTKHTWYVPYCPMEIDTTVGSYGTICPNEDITLLKRNRNGNYYGGGGRRRHGSVKYLPQLPVPLLNPGLSDDQTICRNYRHFLRSHRFVLAKQKQPCQQQLKPGVNNFNLYFTAPDDLCELVKQLSSASAAADGGGDGGSNEYLSIDNDNDHHQDDHQDATPTYHQLWFMLDQLVIYAKVPQPPSPPPTIDDNSNTSSHSSDQFVLIEDFPMPPPPHSCFGARDSSSSSSCYQFRLVSCPPSIEIMPVRFIANTIDHKLFNGKKVVQFNLAESTYAPPLLGTNNHMLIHLNAGSTSLPKGLKCYLNLEPMHSISSSSHGHHHTAGFDHNLVHVSIEELDARKVLKDDDGQVYFHLPRTIGQFGKLVMMIRLATMYRTPLYCMPKHWAVPTVLDTTTNTTVTKSSGCCSPRAPPNSTLTSLEYALKVSWDNNNSSNPNPNPNPNPKQDTIVNCRIKLHQPFHVYTRVKTCGIHKYIEMILYPAAELWSRKGAARVLQQQPQLKKVKFNSKNEARYLLLRYPKLSSIDNEDDDNNTYQLSFVPLTPVREKEKDQEEEEEEEEKPIRLVPKQTIHFVWQIKLASSQTKQSSSIADYLEAIANLKHVQIEITYQTSHSEIWEHVYHHPWQSVCFNLQMFNNNSGGSSHLATRYLIREHLEALYGSRSSELYRVGNICHFKATIERLFPNHLRDEYEEETIQYELQCKSQIWSLVRRTTSTTSNNQVNDNQQVATTTTTNVPQDMSISTTLGEYSLVPTTGSNQSLASNGSLSSCSESNTTTTTTASRVLKLTPNDPMVEIHFEIMPLTSGNVRYPRLRIYRIQHSNDDLLSATTTTSTSPIGGSVEHIIREPPTPTTATVSIETTHTASTSTRHSSSSSSSSKSSNTFESLSARFSENILAKNWTSKLLSANNNSTTSSSSSSSSPRHHRRSDSNSSNVTLTSSSCTPSTSLVVQNQPPTPLGTTAKKSSKLIRFEQGQVYNFNQATHVYVLPASAPHAANVHSNTNTATTTNSGANNGGGGGGGRSLLMNTPTIAVTATTNRNQQTTNNNNLDTIDLVEN